MNAEFGAVFAAVGNALVKAVEGTVPGRLDCPLQKRVGDAMPEPMVENFEGFGLCLKACFWLSLIAVSCMTLNSSFHWAIGKRCFAARALIVALTPGLEAMAALMAILNWLIKCLLVVDSIVNHHLQAHYVSTFPSLGDQI